MIEKRSSKAFNVSLKSLPIAALEPVNPVGPVCFDSERKVITFRGGNQSLSDGAVLTMWHLLRDPAGVRKDQLILNCWHNGTANNLYRAIFDLRQIIGHDAVILEKDLYRLNHDFLNNLPKGKPNHGELIARLLESGSLPAAEFKDLLFDCPAQCSPEFWSETLISAPDALELLRQNAERVAATFSVRRSYFLITAATSADSIPKTLSALYKAICKTGVAPGQTALNQLRAALTIVIAKSPAQTYIQPCFFLNADEAAQCMLFVYSADAPKAVFLSHAESASRTSDSLRADFLSCKEQRMISTPEGFADEDPLLLRLKAGVAHFFGKLGSPELGESAIDLCFEPPRMHAQSETRLTMAMAGSGG